MPTTRLQLQLLRNALDDVIMIYHQLQRSIMQSRIILALDVNL